MSAKILKVIKINLIIFLGFLILIVVGFEIFYRIKSFSFNGQCQGVWHFENVFYREIAKKLPNYKDHFESLKVLSKNGLKYYDYYFYSLKPIKTKTVEITDYYSSRRVPESVPLTDANMVIWIFGGSTIQNLDSPDQETIVNYVAKTLKNNNISPAVFNFGTVAFQSSLELSKFSDLLRRVPSKEFPNIAVFYDGFNDPYYGLESGAAGIQKDFSDKFRMVVERNGFWRRAYFLMYDHVLKYSLLWDRKLHSRMLVWMYALKSDRQSKSEEEIKKYFKKTIEESISVYVRNVMMTDNICQVFNVKCVHILQPMIFSKKPLMPLEQKILDQQSPLLRVFYNEFYQGVSKVLAGHPNFINMSEVLNGRNVVDFYDIGHTSPLGTGKFLGTKIAEELLRR